MMQLPGTQRGFSLIELMVAFTISLILLAGVVQIYISSKNTYVVQDGLSRTQENMRFSFEIMSNDIRMVGFSGCGNFNAGPSGLILNNIVNPPTDAKFEFDDPIGGLNNVGSISYGAISVVPGTDVLIARSASPSSANLVGMLDARNANIQLADNSLGLQAGDILFITDCENADIFRATNVSEGAAKTTIAHSNAGNVDNKLSKAYMTDAQILRYQEHTYFVGDTGRTDLAGDPITALFRQTVNGVEELVEGVEDIQITYGVNTDLDTRNSADTYLDADAIGATQWRNVVSARIAVLLNTVEAVGAGQQQYTFQGVTTTPTDRRLRRSYTTTIALRNRTL